MSEKKIPNVLIELARLYDERAKKIIFAINPEYCGEWLSEITEEFFQDVGTILKIDYNTFADTIFDDHPKVANTPVVETPDGKLIWNNTFGFENYGLKRTWENINNC